ncbi:hypothetical protein [Kamptonema formosum]|nr:hypothetical protein [Oscillatoria sp. PCC 10802]
MSCRCEKLALHRLLVFAGETPPALGGKNTAPNSLSARGEGVWLSEGV